MSNQLQSMFPMIRIKSDILGEIRGNEKLNKKFCGWTQEVQEEFLNFCSGATGNRVLYDAFFKEILNPEYAPERLEELLSLLLGREVKIKEILQPDSTRIADETSLLIMDIVVQLDDGTIANVEIQKRGYAFPGERSACYSSDLLLRQYRRIKSKKEKNDEYFSYRDINKVYTIVFFEKSPKEFKKCPDSWLHHFKQVSDTGVEVDLLQEYVFIPLDIFCTRMQNKPIKNKLEAWLSFFSMSKPEEVLSLISQYPEFKSLYAEIYTICQNTERVIGMFSEELRILDRNTVRYMMDEMQDELNEMYERWNKTKSELDELTNKRDEEKGKLDETKSELDEAKSELDEAKSELDETKSELDEAKSELDETKGELDEAKSELAETKSELDVVKNELESAAIRAFIKACKKFTQDTSIIVNQIREEFAVNQKEAEKMLGEFEKGN